VIGGIGYPALAHRQAAPEPVTPTHKHFGVTVVPPGPRAQAGTIATGTINGQSWRVYTNDPKTYAAQGGQCLVASGPAFGPANQPLSSCGPPSSANNTNPVDFQGLAAGGYAQASFGPVRADVSYVVVRLSSGTSLRLIPVKVYGTRYVAFASPASLTVTGATAYLSDGQYLTAIPFNPPGGWSPIFGLWLSPGQPVPAQVTKLIASGSADGTAWTVQAYVGPWGTCFVSTGVDAGQMGCVVTSMGTQMVAMPGDSPGVVAGSAAAGVRYLTITMTDGSTLRVTPVLVGSQRYFAFYLSKGQQQVRGWAAYNAAGKQVDSGKLNSPAS
jgi:hypothetical protein